MQMIEKMAWKSDGVLHAQVEYCQLDVPSVIPAAMSEPTLLRIQVVNK